MLTSSKTSWGSRADGDANDSHRMSPRARRSESITMPPGNHPGLIRYNDDKSFTAEKLIDSEGYVLPEKHEIHSDIDHDTDGHQSESTLDSDSDACYDS